MSEETKSTALTGTSELQKALTGEEKFNLYIRQQTGDKLVSLLRDRYDLDCYLTQAFFYLQKYPKVRAVAISNPTSFIGAILEAAQFALPIGMNLVYLVPYGEEIVCQVGYQGYNEVAQEHPQVRRTGWGAVYENDHFEADFIKIPPFVHKPPLDKPRGKLIGAYAYAELVNGAYIPEYMSMAEIFHVRDVYSKDWRYATEKKKEADTIWAKSEDQMAIKTVFRRLWKKLPKTERMNRLIEIDDRISTASDIIDQPQENGEMTRRLADKIHKKVEPPIDYPQEPTTEIQEEDTEEIKAVAIAESKCADLLENLKECQSSEEADEWYARCKPTIEGLPQSYQTLLDKAITQRKRKLPLKA